MSGSTEERYRKFLSLMCGLIFAGTIPELVFTEHTQSTLQWVPFILCGLGLLSMGAAWWRPRPRVLRAHRLLMVLIAVGGLFGVYEHLWHNYLFETEIRPNATTLDALGRALFGSSPLMAPGILTLASVLGLAATWRHPEPDNTSA